MHNFLIEITCAKPYFLGLSTVHTISQAPRVEESARQTTYKYPLKTLVPQGDERRSECLPIGPFFSACQHGRQKNTEPRKYIQEQKKINKYTVSFHFKVL